MARTIAKDHDEKRDHILKTAARVFAQEGYARASMSRVARDCGTSKANIYHYYPGKDVLLFAILDNYLRALRDRLMQLPLAGLPPEEKLAALTDQILLAYQGMDHEHKIQTEGIPLLSADKQTILKNYQRDMVRQLRDVLAEIAPETLRHSPDKLHAATMSVFGMLNWFYMWNAKAGKRARQDYANLVTNMTIGGLNSL